MASSAAPRVGSGEEAGRPARLRIIDACSYLLLLGVAARAFAYYFMEEADSPLGAGEPLEGASYRFVVAGLLGAFAALTVARQAGVGVLQRHGRAYLAVQTALVAGLLLVPSHLYYFAILFFPLSIQAMFSLPRRTGYAYIGVFGAIAATAMIAEHGFSEGIGQVLVFIAGFYFFGVFAASTAEAEGAREEARELLYELERREEALRQSEARYRRVVEDCPDAIVILDRDGRVVDANPAAAAMAGRPAAELRDHHGLSAVYPHYDAVHREYVEALLGDPTTTRPVHLKEASLQRADGSVVSVEAQLGLIHLDGRPHVLVIARDVTQRKEAEEALFRQTRDVATLEERNRLAREIHDTLAQGFTGIVLQLEAAEQALDDSRQAVAQHLELAKGLARTSLQEARRSVWDQLPRVLETQSLATALQEELERFNAGGREQARLTVEGDVASLPEHVETGLLRIAQESLTNVRRHAGAQEVDVKLAFEGEAVRLTVRDDGRGFGEDVLTGDGAGFGLRGMRERARLMGGTLALGRGEGGGAVVEVSVPARVPERLSAARP